MSRSIAILLPLVCLVAASCEATRSPSREAAPPLLQCKPLHQEARSTVLLSVQTADPDAQRNAVFHDVLHEALDSLFGQVVDAADEADILAYEERSADPKRTPSCLQAAVLVVADYKQDCEHVARPDPQALFAFRFYALSKSRPPDAGYWHGRRLLHEDFVQVDRTGDWRSDIVAAVQEMVACVRTDAISNSLWVEGQDRLDSLRKLEEAPAGMASKILFPITASWQPSAR